MKYEIESDDDSLVLLSIDGSPKITVNSFEAILNLLAENEPRVKMMLVHSPKDARESLFGDLKEKFIAEEWAIKSGAREDTAYKKKLDMEIRLLQRGLDFEFFLKEHEINTKELAEAKISEYATKFKVVETQDYFKSFKSTKEEDK